MESTLSVRWFCLLCVCVDRFLGQNVVCGPKGGDSGTLTVPRKDKSVAWAHLGSSQGLLWDSWAPNTFQKWFGRALLWCSRFQTTGVLKKKQIQKQMLCSLPTYMRSIQTRNMLFPERSES